MNKLTFKFFFLSYSGVKNKTQCNITKCACVSRRDIKVSIKGCKGQERITVK